MANNEGWEKKKGTNGAVVVNSQVAERGAPAPRRVGQRLTKESTGRGKKLRKSTLGADAQGNWRGTSWGVTSSTQLRNRGKKKFNKKKKREGGVLCEERNKKPVLKKEFCMRNNRKKGLRELCKKGREVTQKKKRRKTGVYLEGNTNRGLERGSRQC